MNLHYKELSAPAQKDGSLSDAVLEDHIKDALTMGVAKFQWLFRKHDGTHFFADVVLSPFPLDGRTLITAMVRDITLQHQTAEALRKREEQFRELVENINDALFSLDQEGRLTFVSPIMKKILGYTQEEMIGRNFMDFIYPEDLNGLTGRFSDLLKGKLMPFEYRVMRKDGSLCWVSTYSRPVSEGGQMRIFGLLTDISERKMAEEALKLSYSKLEDMVHKRTSELNKKNTLLKQEVEARIRTEEELKQSKDRYRQMAQEMNAVLNGITDNITLQDTELRIIWANEAAALSVDMSPADLIGKHCYTLWQKRKSPCGDCPVMKSLADNLEHEGIQSTPDGSLWEIRSYPLKDAEGTMRGAIEITKNVTERKILENELQRREKLEALGLLSGGIAHDFNNLLTVILGNVSLAKMLLDNADKAYKRCEDIENAALRAKDLACQLLTFAKGGSPLKKKVALEGFLRDAVSRSLPEGDGEIELDFSVVEGLWSVEIDELQITQVIKNIMSNAVHSMPEGGAVNVRAENVVIGEKSSLPLGQGPFVKVVFEDTGIGIPQEHLEKIFDPFFTTKNQSYGLGLASSYSILKKHGGHITASSKPSQGTAITFFLPAATEVDREKKAPRKPSPQKRHSILFMDDEEFIRDLAQSIFTHLGYEVTFAREGAEAIRRYQETYRRGRPFDIVILDLVVNEGMGGKECLEKLREIDPLVKAIVSSGYSNDPVMANPQQYGFRDVIAKPYRIQDLRTLLNKILQEP